MKKIILLLLICCTCFPLIWGNNAGFLPTLSSQTPDPATPGSYVFVTIKMSNPGESIIDEASITYIDNEFIKLGDFSTRKQSLGSIPAFSTGDDSRNIVTARYKLWIEEDTPPGPASITFDIQSSLGIPRRYSFDILVADESPSLTMESFTSNPIAPGQVAQLQFSLLNNNEINLLDVEVDVQVEEISDNALYILASGNKQTIPVFASKSRLNFTYDIMVNPTISSQPYLIPVKIKYEDTLGNQYETTLYGTLPVAFEPLISIELDKQSRHTPGVTDVTLAIANPGVSIVKGTELRILPSQDYTLMEGTYHYVGDLNADDFQTIQAKIYVKEENLEGLLVEISYLDSYNKRFVSNITLPLLMYTSAEQRLINKQNGSGFSYVTLFIFIGAGYLAYRYWNKKKNAQ